MIGTRKDRSFVTVLLVEIDMHKSIVNGPQVQSVYTGPQGIIAALRSLSDDHAKSTLCIDSTTLDVNVAREVSKEVHEAGAMMVDAPVSGGSWKLCFYVPFD